jgi:hypothetical protein
MEKRPRGEWLSSAKECNMTTREYCPHCGDPLPLDSHCDCKGDPDRDRTADGLLTHKVVGWNGPMRAILPHRVAEVDRRKRREL